MKVFLGGTVNGSTWRDELITRLKVDYFNPVVTEWDEAARLREIEERENCDFCLYVLTPRMEGVYSVAEVTDDSFKKNDKTIYCYLPTDGDLKFTEKQLVQLERLGKKVLKNGAIWKRSLDEVADFLNSANELENSALLKESSEYKNVFISYGRRNSLAFVRKFAAELEGRGLQVWLDMNDIPLGVDFQTQIDEGIRRADNFVYVISPHSINSVYCEKELSLAIKYNKRIIPILHVEPQDATTWERIHAEIARRNWIYCRQDIDAATELSALAAQVKQEILETPEAQWKFNDPFDKAFESFTTLIDSHRDFVRKHTKLLDSTLEWDKKHRNTQYLLVGKEREDAEMWLMRTHQVFKNPGGMLIQPPCLPTDLMAQYIMESKKNGNNLQCDVFICHAAEDRAKVDKVAAALNRHGFSTWFHDRDIQKGSDYESAILNGLVQSANMLLFVTSNALKSDYCKREYQHALQYNKRVIPIILESQTNAETGKADFQVSLFAFENADNFGFTGLAKLQYINFTDLTNEIPLVVRSRDDVAADVEARHSKTPFELSTDELVNTLNTERHYFEEHRVLLVQALRWISQQQKQSFLLQGFNLDNAATWLRININRNSYRPTQQQIEFIQASEAARGQIGADVFISYSRKDADFARKLNTSLQMAGHTTWFDQESISKGVDFEKEIFKGISGCDNFVFIISPDSVNSPYCQNEVDFAISQNKRIITLLWRKTDVAAIPEQLRLINWIDFESAEYDKSLVQLVQEVETDREYAHAHTRWQQRAQEWYIQKCSKDYLLNASACQNAEAWLSETGKKPLPTQLQLDFIASSREAINAAEVLERKKRKRLQMYLGVAIVALVLAGGLSVVALQQYANARGQISKTEAAKLLAIENANKARIAGDKTTELLRFFIDENNEDSLSYYELILNKGVVRYKTGDYNKAIQYFEIAKIAHTDTTAEAVFEADSLIQQSTLLLNAISQADSIKDSNKAAAILIFKNVLSQNKNDAYAKKQLRNLEAGKAIDDIFDQVKNTRFSFKKK